MTKREKVNRSENSVDRSAYTTAKIPSKSQRRKIEKRRIGNAQEERSSAN